MLETQEKIKPHLKVVAAVIRDGGRVLAVRRPEGKPQAGFWEFPGGKIEAGETPEQALARELDEELGILPTRFAFWLQKDHDYDAFSVTLLFFLVDAIDGVPASREGQALEWMDSGRARSANFLPADSDIVQQLFTL